MPDALDGLSKEELIHYTKTLLDGAIDRLNMDMPEQAAWRVANALGVLGAILSGSTMPIPGITIKTSLGYKLELNNDNTKQV